MKRYVLLLFIAFTSMVASSQVNTDRVMMIR